MINQVIAVSISIMFKGQIEEETDETGELEPEDSDDGDQRSRSPQPVSVHSW